MKINKVVIVAFVLISLYAIKLALNWLLLAENGDTYDFFKIAYFIQNGNWLYDSKRMPFLPILLAPFPSEWFVSVGRIWTNLFYFGSVFVFYKILQSLNIKTVGKNIIFTLIFATNVLVFENSFYILADTPFLFLSLLFILFSTHKKQNNILLTIIAILAFYTRPEGVILTGITFILISQNYIQKNLSLKSYTKNIFYSGVCFLLFIVLPYFLRHYLMQQNAFESDYFADSAGFIFSIKTLAERISNFLFFTGGVFLLPTISLSYSKKHIINVTKLFFNPIFLVFIFNSLVLFLWGPYPRLYSVPAATVIIFLYSIVDLKINTSIKKILLTGFIFLAVSVFYLYVTQILGQNDYGYQKYSKLISLLLSLVIITITVFKEKLKGKYLITLGILIILLNIFVFADKFRFTRYKYYSIKVCVEKYLSERSSKKMAYASLSGMEEWYLKDFDRRYRYLGNSKNFANWAKTNDVGYALTTLESGHKDNIGLVHFSKIKNSQIIKQVKTPFFTGDTKLIKF